MLFIVDVDNDGFKVYDSGGTLIDPAKDQSVQSLLTSLNSIKDTAGIKKITDALPAGTNRIGAVRLLDILDNGINSILNNAIRRLESRASITSPMVRSTLR